MSNAIDTNDSTLLATISMDALRDVTGGDGDKPGDRYRPMTEQEQHGVRNSLDWLKRCNRRSEEA